MRSYPSRLFCQLLKLRDPNTQTSQLQNYKTDSVSGQPAQRLLVLDPRRGTGSKEPQPKDSSVQ